MSPAPRLASAGPGNAGGPALTPSDLGAASDAHVPVMLERCLEALDLRIDAWVVDGTFGAGGHTRAMLARGARVLAVDRDPTVLAHVEALRADLRTAGVRDPGERFRFAPGSFADLSTHLAGHGVPEVRGVLLDLGVSSMQLDEDSRGFSFRHDGPLDMRMADRGESAADIVNRWSFEDLAAAIYRYGEERHSRRLARAIVAARDEAPITTTGRLAEVIARAYPAGPRREHPARRTFQALRIVVNDELGALRRGIDAAADALTPGGRLVVLSYHSLEDRIVKQAFRDHPALDPIVKRPIEASEAEVRANPRARSAKLRVARKRGGDEGAGGPS
jgi:16S rRNA (cytosine1402-N4)-methyltransferase